jgi:hypothetical protein
LEGFLGRDLAVEAVQPILHEARSINGMAIQALLGFLADRRSGGGGGGVRYDRGQHA